MVEGTTLSARLLDWGEEPARGGGRRFGAFGKGVLLPNCLPPKSPAYKCGVHGEAALDLLLDW